MCHGNKMWCVLMNDSFEHKTMTATWKATTSKFQKNRTLVASKHCTLALRRKKMKVLNMRLKKVMWRCFCPSAYKQPNATTNSRATTSSFIAITAVGWYRCCDIMLRSCCDHSATFCCDVLLRCLAVRSLAVRSLAVRSQLRWKLAM